MGEGGNSQISPTSGSKNPHLSNQFLSHCLLTENLGQTGKIKDKVTPQLKAPAHSSVAIRTHWLSAVLCFHGPRMAVSANTA